MPKKKNTQEAAKEAIAEARAEAAPKKEKLIAYAPFEIFKEGDEFEIPEGWHRDENYEQMIVNKQKPRQGMVFISAKGNRVILPVKEA